MAAFNFPNSPSTNDTHTENSVTWKWDGTVWKRQGVAGAQGAAGAQGHQGVQGAANATTINDNAATYVITGSSTANTLNAIDEFTYTEATGVMQCGRNGIIPTFQAGGTNTDIAVAAKGPGGLVYLKTNGTNKFAVAAAGDVTVKTGNLVIETAGKGIDFSAQTSTSATGGTATSELLDHYEEGTWTPVFTGSGGDPTYSNWHTTGTYIRVGGVCHVWYDPIQVTFSGTDSAGYGRISGFPFASTDNGSLACGQMVDILKWGGNGNLRDSGFSMDAAGASGQFHTAAPSVGFTWDNGNASNKGYFDLGGSYKCV